MTIEPRIEALLFASAKPLSFKKLSELLGVSVADIQEGVGALKERLSASSGLQIQTNDQLVELATKPEHADVVSKVAKDEQAGELSRASLETLTILAYCGPMTRPELEQIRGIQSSMIIRNLMLRGLIEEAEEERLGQQVYRVTFDFLNHLGIASVDQLPDYAVLRGNESIADVLKELETSVPKGPIAPTIAV